MKFRLRSSMKALWERLRRVSLHKAAEHGHLEVATLLLDQGARVEAINKHGTTPLHLATMNGHLEVATLLLDRGASVETKKQVRGGCRGRCWARHTTALNMAANKGHLEVVRLLLDRGASMEATSTYGMTALHEAAVKGHLEVVALLLDRGASAGAIVGSGYICFAMTALHCVVSSHDGRPEVAALLLDRGASVAAINKYDQTALHMAAMVGNLEMVTLLLDRGARVEPTNNHGQTALHSAVIKGHLEVAALLLDRGASVKATSKAGRTAFEVSLLNAGSKLRRDNRPILCLLLLRAMAARGVASGGVPACARDIFKVRRHSGVRGAMATARRDAQLSFPSEKEGGGGGEGTGGGVCSIIARVRRSGNM